MKKRALITGINGQDGSYLADYLLGLDYEVFGLIRRTATDNTRNITHILDRVTLLYGDLLDQSSLTSALIAAQPDEVYNLAAQSFVGESWKQPINTAEITGLGAMRILEAIKGYNRRIKFYQASTSEMFGNAQAPQDESTPFAPRSPYGVAKLFAHHATINYRESYGMFAACGILFNHESPRRGTEFVTRKITSTIGRIIAGKEKILRLGNLDASRDWGHAKDYVRAMHAMMQLEKPQDFVIGTGETHTVRQFVLAALAHAGLDGSVIKIDPELFRPAEVNQLCANPEKARRVLNWTPQIDFDTLVAEMVDADIAAYKN